MHAAHIESSKEQYLLSAISPSLIILNGKKTKKAYLSFGDRFTIGNFVFVLDKDEAQTSGLDARQDVVKRFAGLARAITDEKDIKQLLSAMLGFLIDSLHASNAFILVCDQTGHPEVFVSSDPGDAQHRFSDTIVQHVIATRQCVTIANAMADPAFSGARSVSDLHLASVVCCPLNIADQPVGVMYAGSNKAAISYGVVEENIVSMCAMNASIFINHLRRISQQAGVIQTLTESAQLPGFIAQSRPMQEVLRAMRTLSDSDIAILIQGETGTGKDLVAGLIHKNSKRSGKPFVVLNCSALRHELIESELFGHKKGSFTGAISNHDGLFKAAHGGTLFLDEIGEMNLELQAKLLRAIETGKIRAVGSSTEESIDVRIICATNRNIREMADKGEFRQDLFFRLNQFCIELPPVRKRGEDISLLAYCFLEKYRAQYPQKNVIDFHPDALKALATYAWPGNVREMSNVIHKAVLSSQGSLVMLEMKPDREIVPNFESATREFQLSLINRALEMSGGNREQAASLLGIHRSTIFRYLNDPAD
jgi:transcriptional regulator with GAF, ATPase, and Fis domain